jgi:hypothetical protein
MASPTQVVPSGSFVTFQILMMLPFEETVTITAVDSALYGDLAEPGNQVLEETTCVVPFTVEPDDYFGAYDWGCDYRVWIEGEPGEFADTITVIVAPASGGEVQATTRVAVTISTATGVFLGTITDDVTGAPVAGIPVTALGPIPADAHTDTEGRFSLGGLLPGEYRLNSGNVEGFSSEYAAEWWDDAPDFESATVVTVFPGEATTIDWALSLGGVISGTVTDEVTGTPIAGADVSWSAVGGDGLGFIGGFYTGDDGAYRIPGLRTSDYVVCFDAPGYEGECWDDRKEPGGTVVMPGDPVGVEVRAITPGIDAALTPETAPVATTVESTTGQSLPATGAPPHTIPLALLALTVLLAGPAMLAGRGAGHR